MSSLPSNCVTSFQPFSIGGIVSTGTFYIKCDDHRMIKYSKTYVAVFVWMVTRAVHLETVLSFFTGMFLYCYQRFIGRRGNPKILYSNTGTNFIGTERYLNLNDNRIQKLAAESYTRSGNSIYLVPLTTEVYGKALSSQPRSYLMREENDERVCKINFRLFY